MTARQGHTAPSRNSRPTTMKGSAAAPAVTVLAPARRLSLETLAEESDLHPELVRRFVTLGLLDADRDAEGRLWFAPSAPLEVARIQRLRAGFCLNYASLGLVLDLLDRIAVLEAALRRGGVRSDHPSWT